MTARILAPILALLLTACSGSPPDEGPPPDRHLEQTNLAGTRALALNQTAEAIKQYRAALTLAYERDDAVAR